MVALGARDGGPVTIDERRRAFARLMQFSKPLQSTVNIDDLSVDDLRVGHLALRRYVPDGLDDPSPALLYFHGGGLVAGSLETHDNLCRTLARGARCRVLAVDYRLAPEHPFPAAIVDALAATRWVLRHAGDLGLRPDAIAIGGDSGGATLATIACQVICRSTTSGRRPRAQVLLCPALDFAVQSASRLRFASGFLLDAATLAADLVHYAPQRPLEDPRLSPLRARTLAGLPTTIIHTAAFDPLLDEGAAYARRLVEAGVDVRYRCHDALLHHFYALNGFVPAADIALSEIARDIAETLA